MCCCGGRHSKGWDRWVDGVYEGISRGDRLRWELGRRRTRRVACQMRQRFKRDHESLTKELKDKEAGIKNENQTRAVRTCLHQTRTTTMPAFGSGTYTARGSLAIEPGPASLIYPLVHDLAPDVLRHVRPLELDPEDLLDLRVGEEQGVRGSGHATRRCQGHRSPVQPRQ